MILSRQDCNIFRIQSFSSYHIWFEHASSRFRSSMFSSNIMKIKLIVSIIEDHGHRATHLNFILYPIHLLKKLLALPQQPFLSLLEWIVKDVKRVQLIMKQIHKYICWGRKIKIERSLYDGSMTTLNVLSYEDYSWEHNFIFRWRLSIS